MLGTPAVAALALAAIAFVAPPLSAQSFAGTWVNDAPTNVSQIRLVLAQNGASVTGTLSGAGTTVPVEGVVRDAALEGRAAWGNGTVLMEGELVGDGLELLLISPGPDGQPDYERANYIEFVRAGAEVGAQVAAPMASEPTNVDGGAMSTSPAARQWAAQLTGKKLSQIESYGGSDGGYSRRRELHLCPSGGFQYSESNSVNADVGGVFGGGSGGDSGTGQWRVLAEGQLVGLDLRFSDGRHWQVRLEYRDGGTYIDGVRTYVTPGAACP